MKIEVTANKEVEPGIHKGVISDVTYRVEPYEYTDVHIEMSPGVVVKAGYPTNINPVSNLGRLLIRFGAKLVVGQELDPNQILVGKKCVLQTTNEEKGGITYCKVLAPSVCPE